MKAAIFFLPLSIISGKHIFISPLDWGLGHATRCVPLIHQLKKENTVIVGVTESHQSFFDQWFPELKKIQVPSYHIRYSAFFPAWMKILSESGKIQRVIHEEHRLMDSIIKRHAIDLVISDNRYGFYSLDVHSVLMTHQLNIFSPLLASLANRKNKKFLAPFHEVWVPDYEEKSLSLAGNLSHPDHHIHPNIKYIGPLSRLEHVLFEESESYDYLFLLSGPEPQRTLLENLVLTRMKHYQGRWALVRGSNLLISEPSPQQDNLSVINFPSDEKIKSLILNSKKIVCRSGYSTLMDLHLLNKNKKDIILVPTPGQTEQEYLAYYWHKKYSSVVFEQKNFNTISF